MVRRGCANSQTNRRVLTADRSRFTHAFEAEVLRRARDCSISGVCRQLGLHWTSVMRLIERWGKDLVLAVA